MIGLVAQETPPKWEQLSAVRSPALSSPYLININQAALYWFEKDGKNPTQSDCNDACAKKWPPVTIKEGGSVYLAGVKEKAVGAIRRADGDIQITVGNLPIYRFAGDSKPGDLNGQGVDDVWFAVGPDGEPVKNWKPAQTVLLHHQLSGLVDVLPRLGRVLAALDVPQFDVGRRRDRRVERRSVDLVEVFGGRVALGADLLLTVLENSDAESSVYFSVLGPVRVWRDDVEVPLRATQQTLLLTLLLARAGEAVSLGEIVDLLWGEDPPANAINVVYRYVGTLRRLLEPGLRRRQVGRWLLPEASGYRLDVTTETLDLLRFRHALDQARVAARRGQPEQAVAAYADGFALWRASLTAGLPPEVQDHPVFTALEREHLAAVKEAADVALGCRLVTPVLAVMQHSVERHPLDEPLQARLILALWTDGHQAGALAAYRRARAQLRTELGIEPGPELESAGRRVQSGRPSPEPDRNSRDANQWRRPAQLPGNLVVFAGREQEIGGVLSLLAEHEEQGATVVISGMAGVGKTTLAVHLAHQVAERYPDGQIYINLRGFDPTGSVTDPSDAIGSLLAALGAETDYVPDDLEARAALYRSLLSGRRVLIVLDNARDHEQIRPLLPGVAGCLVLVTSRHQQAALVALDGAHPLTLDLLSRADARSFLSRRLGRERVNREPRAIDQIVERCGRLPLALAIIAARATMNPSFTMAVIADELDAAAARLDTLHAPGVRTDLRTVFSWSFRALTPAAARLFRLLGLHPGPDIALPAAASLAGASIRQVRALIAELTHASLLTEYVPGRYLLHDLLRLYAVERAETIDRPQDTTAAKERILDHYLHSARTAACRYSTTLIPIELPDPAVGVTPEAVIDRDQALAWFTQEHPVLREVLRQAARDGRHRHTWQLVWSLEFFLDRLGHWEEAATFARMATVSATELDEPIARAHAHFSLGRAFNLLRNDDGARTQLRLALGLFERVGHLSGQASTLHYTGFLAERLGENEEALHYSTRALDLYQVMEDRLGQAMALNSIGNLKSLLGDPAGALPNCRQALRLFQELGDHHGEAAAWDSLGYTVHQQGLYQEAISHYTNALKLFREEGARHFEAVILDHLGDAWQDCGSPDVARRAWRDAIAIYAEFDRPAAHRISAKLTMRNESGSPVAPGVA